jgi:hypothetical protein
MRHPSTTFAKAVLCFSRRFEQERQANVGVLQSADEQ